VPPHGYNYTLKFILKYIFKHISRKEEKARYLKLGRRLKFTDPG